MTVIRQTRRIARNVPPGRLALLLSLLLAVVAACGPGNGGGPGY
jgi:hypothetical protein